MKYLILISTLLISSVSMAGDKKEDNLITFNYVCDLAGNRTPHTIEQELKPYVKDGKCYVETIDKKTKYKTTEQILNGIIIQPSN